MAGNPANAALWAEADVYVAPFGSPKPASITDPFPAAWTPVGLLNGENGFVTTREQDKTNHSAWGGILVRVSRGAFQLTKTFTVLEDNAITRSLIWPGSPVGKIVVPKPGPILIGFETREGGAKHRLITSNYAEVDLNGDVTENETDLTQHELVATIFPTGDAELFIEQSSAGTVATLASALPSGAAAGEVVVITGVGFTGATAVKFGATNATLFTVDSNSQITAVVPPGAAGSAAIKVTTPVGESAGLAYTRG